MIKRFKESCGKNITKLIGQDRLGFAMTGSSDLDDLVEWAKRGGYQGSNILFFDFENGKVYIEAWIEEGWDEENDCATDKYEYYNKIIIKDYFGNTLSEETGALYQGQDGTWWIA